MVHEDMTLGGRVRDIGRVHGMVQNVGRVQSGGRVQDVGRVHGMVQDVGRVHGRVQDGGLWDGGEVEVPHE